MDENFEEIAFGVCMMQRNHLVVKMTWRFQFSVLLLIHQLGNGLVRGLVWLRLIPIPTQPQTGPPIPISSCDWTARTFKLGTPFTQNAKNLRDFYARLCISRDPGIPQAPDWFVTFELFTDAVYSAKFQRVRTRSLWEEVVTHGLKFWSSRASKLQRARNLIRQTKDLAVGTCGPHKKCESLYRGMQILASENFLNSVIHIVRSGFFLSHATKTKVSTKCQKIVDVNYKKTKLSEFLIRVPIRSVRSIRFTRSSDTLIYW